MVLPLFIMMLVILIFIFSLIEIIRDKKKVKASRFLYESGKYLYRKIKKWLSIRSVSFQDELLQTDQFIEERYGKIIGVSLFIIFIGSIISFALFQQDPIYVSELERPDFGKQQSYELIVEGNETGTVSIDINGRKPNEDEIIEIFDQSFEELKTIILANNESFLSVSYGLNFIDTMENGIQVQYESTDTNYLSNYGLMITDIPEEGVELVLKINLLYEEYKKEYLIPIRLIPLEEEKDFFERLEEEILLQEERENRKDYLSLPNSFEGISLIYQEEKTSPLLILCIFIFVGILLLYLPREEDQKEIKKRKELLKREYPNMLSQMSMLTEAGLSIRGSFSKIIQEYEDQKRKDKNYLMEELKWMMNQIEAGQTETEAYLTFGKRSGLQNYLRFSNILSQSVRQGVSGLKEVLREEMKEALNERKALALRKGEEATTKQLFPMLLMLIIVIIVLLVPTLSSF